MTCRWLSVAAAVIVLASAGPVEATVGLGGQSGLGLGGRYAYVRNQDTEETAHTGGVAARLRGASFGLEGTVDYRSEDLPGNAKLKSWPVTASLLVFPVPIVYGLAGIGWYSTTVDFPDDSPFENETDRKLGYHFGAGAEIPVAPSVSLTGDARWLFIDHDFEEIPSTIGEVGADWFALNFGLLLYLK